MDLTRNSMFYSSVLTAKQNALRAAATLAVQLEQDISELKNAESIECAKNAVEAFKLEIIGANGMRKSSNALLTARKSLDPLNQIIPDAQAAAHKELDRCLYWYDFSEYNQKRLNKGGIMTGGVIGAAIPLAPILLLGLFGPPGAFILLMPVCLLFCILAVAATLDSIKTLERHTTRDVISDRVAIAPEVLHELLYPLSTNTAEDVPIASLVTAPYVYAVK